MIESDQRKATFLRTCIRELNLRAEVISERVERVEPQAGDVVSARALAALPDLLPWVHRHLAPDGVAILPKGRTAASEIAAAQQHWHFDLQQTASAFGDGSILVLRDIQRAA
ncbi:rRNA small subunit methyltransferase G [Pseudoroseicyclus aestuarii]|uniref:rRNA small subunit methyltransferase G n=2 Tax=Pseudoroseicyclus aestuarii TaxID=1795041 RepID=A0A318T2M1_9RHOB|nr:rRNA small subunit methyltransferase G [Pseudoroseicyclus aestuarii]